MNLKSLSLMATALIAISVIQFSAAQKLYKWVDEDGNVSYQDSPPPDNAKLLKESELEKSQPAAGTPSNSAQPVVVYTVENCDACEVLLLRLRQLEVPFTQQSLLNKDIQAEILAVSDAITAPTLKIGSEFINDLGDSNLIQKLRQAGLNPVVESQTPNSPDSSNSSPRGPNDPGVTPG